MTDNKDSAASPVFAAATVLLLRDGAQGLEVFMVVRHHEIDSFSGALVFPGGKVDDADSEQSLRSHCSNNESLSSEDLAFQVAAVREAFEECGVLLARRAGQNALLSGEDVQALNHYRPLLVNNEIGMAALCEQEGLQLALDQLTLFSHWITPKVRPKIFDTKFFLAPAPADQLAIHDGSESLDSMWLNPAEAVAQAEQGKLTVVFPTRMNLLRLGHDNSVEAAINTASTSTIVPVQPVVERSAEGAIMNIPSEAGYAGSRILVPKDGRVFTVLA